MPSFLSRPLTVLGLILLSHAYEILRTLKCSSKANILSRFRRCYSAYEHSCLPSTAYQASTLAQSPSSNLPLDISIETILSVIFICVGLVVGAEDLKPISWRVWAGKVERESGGGGPFQGSEDRMGFVDIRVGIL